MEKSVLDDLKKQFNGELHYDDLRKALYATDASVYRKIPTAVAYPKNIEDLKTLIAFATDNKIGLVPRTAGTSLAGQCVGEGIIVDTSRYFNKIISFDQSSKQVTVQPGVVRDELNLYLKPYKLFFGPNTSTSNRCMIGGMVGNNSSGTTSIKYGVTRDKVIAMKTVLSDGSEAVFEPLNKAQFEAKTNQKTKEGELYYFIKNELGSKEVKDEITNEFPKATIHRRNTGYAVDELLSNEVFGDGKKPFNFCKLLAGSEGTLAFTTEITLQLDELPPNHSAMVCTHYHSLEDCLGDVATTMQHDLHLCEMMDKVILDCTKNNRQQLENRFFVEGDPAAILMLELKADSTSELDVQVSNLLKTVEKSGKSYANPILYGNDINKAIELRKAGLGLLGNMVGDKKAVACIEDTAVDLVDLKKFILEFSEIMKGYGQEAVYYAHAGAGELHLRPILNLKKSADVGLFRQITTDVAKLTKKYKGSFSGEHGDGIVRAEFIPLMIGEKNYELLKRLKNAFDPHCIFNPGKIVDPYAMDEALRYEIDRVEPEINTILDFSDNEGILKAAEKCNGSGDCRKSHEMKGGMCPSYHATKDEKDTTRARANVLREFLTNSEKKNRFNHEEVKEAYDLCLSCKACAKECPSNVDVSTLKAEFLFQYQEANGYSFRSKLFAHNTKLNALGSKIPLLANAVFESKVLSGMLKSVFGVAPKRMLPKVHNFNFERHKHQNPNNSKNGKKVVLYLDEFTKYLDIEVGKDAIELLQGLGYEVQLFYAESGRTYLSKGYLKQAKGLAMKNVERLRPFFEKELPMVGLEPSAILSFRDEYKRMVNDTAAISKLSEQAYLIEEFLASEIEAGAISAAQFTEDYKEVKIHAHCHQKALSNQKVTFEILNLPKNYKVTIIPSGCCGMAGSFGYEKEHYEVSMNVGELKLFPAVRKADKDTLISANGTSCRHQIFDGTGKKALHPVSILRRALISC